MKVLSPIRVVNRVVIHEFYSKCVAAQALLVRGEGDTLTSLVQGTGRLIALVTGLPTLCLPTVSPTRL